MPRNSTETRDQSDLEASISDNASKTAILNTCALEFFTSCTTAPFKSTVRVDDQTQLKDT